MPILAGRLWEKLQRLWLSLLSARASFPLLSEEQTGELAKLFSNVFAVAQLVDDEGVGRIIKKPVREERVARPQVTGRILLLY